MALLYSGAEFSEPWNRKKSCKSVSKKDCKIVQLELLVYAGKKMSSPRTLYFGDPEATSTTLDDT